MRWAKRSRDAFDAGEDHARNIFGNVGATINGRLESTDSRGLNGLPIARLTLADGTTVNRALDDTGFLPLAQISVTDYLGGIDWKGHDQTARWYRGFKSRPSFRPLLSERMELISPPAHYDNVDF